VSWRAFRTIGAMRLVVGVTTLAAAAALAAIVIAAI